MFVSRSVAPLFFFPHTFANCHPFPIPSPTQCLSLTTILTASDPSPLPHHPSRSHSHSHSHSHFPSSLHLHTVLAVPEPAAASHRTGIPLGQLMSLLQWHGSTMHPEPRSNRNSMPPASSRAPAPWSLQSTTSEHPDIHSLLLTSSLH